MGSIGHGRSQLPELFFACLLGHNFLFFLVLPHSCSVPVSSARSCFPNSKYWKAPWAWSLDVLFSLCASSPGGHTICLMASNPTYRLRMPKRRLPLQTHQTTPQLTCLIKQTYWPTLPTQFVPCYQFFLSHTAKVLVYQLLKPQPLEASHLIADPLQQILSAPSSLWRSRHLRWPCPIPSASSPCLDLCKGPNPASLLWPLPPASLHFSHRARESLLSVS
jgi:hypothetical protein